MIDQYQPKKRTQKVKKKAPISHPQIVTHIIDQTDCLNLQINTFLECIESCEEKSYFPSIIDFALDILKYTKNDESYSQQRNKLNSLLSMCETDDTDYSTSILSTIKEFLSS